MFTYSYIHNYSAMIVWTLALALLPASPAKAQVGLGLAPMREELNLAPGAQHTGVLSLANHTDQKVRVVTELMDFYLDSTATPQFGREYKQESEFSCRQWLAANPMEAELNGQATIQARYTVRVPPTAQPRSYHCAVSFTTQRAAEGEQAMGIRTAVQIVAAIYVVVGQPAPQGIVKALKLEYVSDAHAPGWRAMVVIANSGMMHFRPVGDLDVLNESGAVVETAHFVPIPILPQRDQNIPLPLKLAQGPGKYTLRARVDLGGSEIQEATALVVANKPTP